MKTYYTITASSLIFALADNPISLLILQYILIRKGVEKGWRFRITDMAKQLRKHEQTIKKYIKPLIELGLLTLSGKVGREYYKFNTNTYNKYLRLNPFNAVDQGESVCPDGADSVCPDQGEGIGPDGADSVAPYILKSKDNKERESKEAKSKEKQGAGTDSFNKSSPSQKALAVIIPAHSLSNNHSGNGASRFDETLLSKETAQCRTGADAVSRKTLNGFDYEKTKRIAAAGREYTKQLTGGSRL